MKNIFRKETGFPRQNLKQASGGFTIIEVVLVLAIAGLIFLMVFLALPQLQASRRDTQRKSDAGRILAGAENFASNRNGVYPSSVDSDWIATNMPGDFTDPSGIAYDFVSNQTALDDSSAGTIYYSIGSQCTTDGSSGFVPGAPRDIAVQMKLEAGIFCQDNR